jgi:putative hydrolase of the HAD superfamily
MIKAVFFDAGHTLLYAHPDLGTIYAQTTAALGVRLPPERFAEVFIPVFQEAVKTYAGESVSSDAHDYAMWRAISRRIYDGIEALREIDFDVWFEALYRRFGEPEVWRFYEDVEPALKDLRARGLKLGVVSNWDTRLRGICEGLGLCNLVDFIVISAEVGVRKPDPRIFHVAIEKAGVRPEEALHVGDLPEEDVEGARRAAIRPVLIDRPRRITAWNLSTDACVIGSLNDIVSLL